MTKRSRTTLADEIVQTVKSEIRDGVYPPGERLPTEAALGERFAVSRATVRSAIKELDVLGLVWTQQGAGTFVRLRPTVRDGLEKMGSISDSIRASGKTPGHEYGRQTTRGVLPDEAKRMGVASDTEVVELRRRITADGEVVAYSFDLIPAELFPSGFRPGLLEGSIFRYFEDDLGIHPTLGLAEVHAVESNHIAWGPGAVKHRLFVLLDQLHYDRAHRLLMYSRTYFIEGVYSFELVRKN